MLENDPGHITVSDSDVHEHLFCQILEFHRYVLIRITEIYSSDYITTVDTEVKKMKKDIREDRVKLEYTRQPRTALMNEFRSFYFL